MKQFEEYLKKLKFSHKVLIYLMPMIVAFGVSFVYLLPLQEDEIINLEDQNSKLQANIKRKSPKTVKRQILQIKNEVLTLKEKNEQDFDSLNFLYAKLTNLEISEFSEKEWTLTLDEILKKSLNLNIDIKHIKNSNSKNLDKTKSIVPKKYVEIIGNAKFSDTMKYLNFIENQQFLVDIKNIKMQKSENSENIDFHINFTIYGVNI